MSHHHKGHRTDDRISKNKAKNKCFFARFPLFCESVQVKSLICEPYSTITVTTQHHHLTQFHKLSNISKNVFDSSVFVAFNVCFAVRQL